MAEDAYEYTEKLPESRFQRRLKRLRKLSEGTLSTKARPGVRGGLIKPHQRRRKKEGGLYAP